MVEPCLFQWEVIACPLLQLDEATCGRRSKKLVKLDDVPFLRLVVVDVDVVVVVVGGGGGVVVVVVFQHLCI